MHLKSFAFFCIKTLCSCVPLAQLIGGADGLEYVFDWFLNVEEMADYDHNVSVFGRAS